jgi:hypothetical protein
MRKLHLDNGKVVEYKVGKTYVVFKFTPTNRLVVTVDEIKGLRQGLVDRGRRKKTSDGQITPRELKTFISVHMGLEQAKAGKLRKMNG